jgi:DNA-binding NarL/FixJ family response regulator
VGRHRKSKYTSQAFALLPPLLTGPEWGYVVRVFEFTPQQSRIVEQILLGKRDKKIAAELDISIWTVRSHLTKIFVRLSVSDRSELLLRIFHLVREKPGSPHRRN